MGVFDDKKFEQMEWMAQITETIDSEINGLLARLPDVIEMDYSTITSFMAESYSMSIDAGNVVRKYLAAMPDKPKLDWETERLLMSCFTLEYSSNLRFDFKSNKMDGFLKVVKMRSSFEDEELQSMMGKNGINAISRCNSEQANIGRLNEILELLGGCEDGLKGRSVRRKVQTIRNRLNKIMANNEWRIRDMDLADKIGYWIRDYVLTGNLGAFSNFCKVKVMTHNNMPIYSIEEQE